MVTTFQQETAANPPRASSPLSPQFKGLTAVVPAAIRATLAALKPTPEPSGAAHMHVL